MKRHALALAALVAAPQAALAAGIDRTRLDLGILYEEGNYLELGYSRVTTDVSGTYSGIFGPFGGSSTNDMAGDFSTFSLAYKHQFTDRLAFALILSTPYGADADYTAGPYTGLNATWKSRQLAAVFKYDLTDNVSAHAGVKYLRSSAQIGIPGGFFEDTDPAPPALPNPYSAGYSARGETDEAVGYIIGAAYERPEIALRLALAYESEMTHSFQTTETVAFAPGTFQVGTTTVKIPQSLTLDFQTGIAKDTLIFGSVRWAEWSVWAVRPPGYGAVINDNITDFDEDVFTLSLGIGRKLSESLSVFARVGHERSAGGVSSRLSPTDGYTSFGVGGTWTKDNIKITGGVEYVSLGDAVDGSGVQFEGNDAIGVGISIGFQF